MKKIHTLLLAGVVAASALGGRATKKADANDSEMVRVADGEFMIGDSVYRFVGVNMWYGAILGSEGRGGDRQRLERELDSLEAIGVNNLRILVGGDGEEGIPSHISPVLQTGPGQYNDTLLRGLDYLLTRLEAHNMKAVLYLNNAWEWSGGYGAYLEWAGAGKAPVPVVDGWDKYQTYIAQFVHNDSAKQLVYNHIRNIVGRTNSITGKPYKDSPAIMTWEIANEPRAFGEDSLSKARLEDYILTSARIIKEIDPNHLVSTGSEGLYGCERDLDLWARIHQAPEIDYAIFHLWPYNWRWVDSATTVSGVDSAWMKSKEYIEKHINAFKGKPIVLEEFGYPRDFMSYAPGSPTVGRDKFFEYVLDMIFKDGKISGCNIWGWGGTAVPRHDNWQAGDPYVGDPAQEPQGLYSVFAADRSTIDIIKRYSHR